MQIFIFTVLFLFSGTISSYIFFSCSKIKGSNLLKVLLFLSFGAITYGFNLITNWIELGDSNTLNDVTSAILLNFSDVISYIVYTILLSIFLPLSASYLYRIIHFIIKKTNSPKITFHISGAISIVVCIAYLVYSAIPIIDHLELIDHTYNDLIKLVDYQSEVDESIAETLSDKSYTAENPYIQVNPYSNSPLTGIIVFSTDVECYVSVEVDDGLSEKSGDSHTFTEATTEHIIPVYGLYADTNNTVIYTVYESDSNISTSYTASMQTDPLPSNFNDLIISANVISAGYTEGLNFIYSDDTVFSEKYAFDSNGEIRWILTDIIFGQVSEVYNNNFWFNTIDDDYIVEIDKLGKIHTIHDLEYHIHHDIEATDSGNLLIASANSGDSYEDFIFEIDGETGDVVNTLDLREVFSRNRLSFTYYAESFTRNEFDWFHLNSIEYIAEDESIIISGNFQSTVAKISWPEGEVEWILADSYDWMTYYEQFLLTPIGEVFEYSYNQHAAYLLPDLDNDPNTIDITVFDNGCAREYASEFYYDIDIGDEEYSRIVHYRINETTMEVEQIYEYGKDRGEELFSQIRSDANYLEETGNYMGLFDRWQPDNVVSYSTYPAIVEANSDGEVIFEAELFAKSTTGRIESYQADRLPLYFDNESYPNIFTAAVILV